MVNVEVTINKLLKLNRHQVEQYEVKEPYL